MLTKSGGGYFYDELLEYRVWVHPGGSDTYRSFASYPLALAYSRQTAGAEVPLALVLQREWIDEPVPRVYIHHTGKRITEWQVPWLVHGHRGPTSIADFLRTHH